MKKWQRNPWQVPNCIPPYDVVELDEKGKTIFSHSYRRRNYIIRRINNDSLHWN